MVKYREILRLCAQGISQRVIVSSNSNSRNTIREVLKRAEKSKTKCPLDEGVTDQDLQELLFPEKHISIDFRRKPDCDHIHKELAKPGVNSVESIMIMPVKRKRQCVLNINRESY